MKARLTLAVAAIVLASVCVCQGMQQLRTAAIGELSAGCNECKDYPTLCTGSGVACSTYTTKATCEAAVTWNGTGWVPQACTGVRIVQACETDTPKWCRVYYYCVWTGLACITGSAYDYSVADVGCWDVH